MPFWRRINLWYFFQVKKNIIVIVEFFKNCINFHDKNVSFEEPYWTASSKFIIDFNEIFSIKEIKDDNPSNAIKRLSWTFMPPDKWLWFLFLTGYKKWKFLLFWYPEVVSEAPSFSNVGHLSNSDTQNSIQY